MSINFIFYLILFIGIIQSATSEKRSGILRSVLLIIFVEHAISLLYFFYWIFPFVSYVSENPDYEYSILMILLGILIHVFWAGGVFWALRFLGKKDIFKEYSYGEGETKQIIVQEQGNKKRFWNMVVDSIVFTFLFIKYIIGFAFEFEINDGWQAKVYLYGTSFICFVIAYTLCEYLFQSTPGKYLTNGRTTNDEGDKPGFGKVVLRSMIRFVPFDALSFLASRGWHDHWSRTNVVEVDYKTS